ncbi:MAG: hypothetical protein HY832_03305 [Candidatus Aenigmarchaeota archaeon]|nr:hypothetical protein [Candidatus Aenigmarchaeota archaeon]
MRTKELKHYKSGQTITLDLIIGVTIFITVIVLFYYLFGVGVTKTEEEDAAQKVVEGLAGNSYFSDGELDSDEVEALSEMNCSTMKTFFDTNKNICIYATDTSGHIVELNNTIAIGCPGIEIDNVICGHSS